MRPLLPAVLILFVFLSPPLAAQRLSVPLFARAAPAAPPPVYSTDDFDPHKAVVAGILGAATGLVGGAILGHQFETRPCDFCIEMALLGGFIGASVGSPVGVHLSNGRRGRVAPAILASLAIGVVGSGAAAALHDGRVLLFVPILQIASAVTIERRTAPH